MSQVRTCLAREFAFLGASDALTVTERTLAFHWSGDNGFAATETAAITVE